MKEVCLEMGIRVSKEVVPGGDLIAEAPLEGRAGRRVYVGRGSRKPWAVQCVCLQIVETKAGPDGEERRGGLEA